MKKFIKNIFIVILILLVIFSIVEVPLIIDGYMKVKEEEKIDKGKIEIHDNEIINSIRNTLTDLFVIGDSQLDEQVFLSENLKYIREFFYQKYDFENNTDEFSPATMMFKYFYYNLKSNYDKENLKTSINIKNVYKLENDTYEVEFIVSRGAIDTKSKKSIKTEEEYYVDFINKNGKFLINKIYNIKDFNQYIIKEQKIAQYYVPKSTLYKKYKKFKIGQYNDIRDGYKTKEMINNEGYII